MDIDALDTYFAEHNLSGPIRKFRYARVYSQLALIAMVSHNTPPVS